MPLSPAIRTSRGSFSRETVEAGAGLCLMSLTALAGRREA